MFDEDDGVSLPAFIILYIVAAGIWTWTANFWIDKGVEITVFFRIIVYAILIPVAYFIGMFYANKE